MEAAFFHGSLAVNWDEVTKIAKMRRLRNFDHKSHRLPCTRPHFDFGRSVCVVHSWPSSAMTALCVICLQESLTRKEKGVSLELSLGTKSVSLSSQVVRPRSLRTDPCERTFHCWNLLDGYGWVMNF